MRHLTAAVVAATLVACQGEATTADSSQPPDLDPLHVSLDSDEFITRAGVSPVIVVTFVAPNTVPSGVAFEFDPPLEGVTLESGSQPSISSVEVGVRVGDEAVAGVHTPNLVATAPGWAPSATALHFEIVQ